MTRIVIAEDHAIVRGGLKQIFAITPGLEVVAEAVSGDAVVSTIAAHPCDLLLLDINLPGISGVDLITRIKIHHPTVPVLILTMHDSPHVASRMLKAGADGFITKDSEPDLLIGAIRKVARGERYLAPDIAQKMALMASTTHGAAPHTALSDRENEVFSLLLKGVGVNEIAVRLKISNKTVSTHKMRLMEKLQTSSHADLMRYAMQHKLLD